MFFCPQRRRSLKHLFHESSRTLLSTEAQVKVHKCGMCMTDVHLMDTGVIGNIVLSSPTVIGHEFSGVISKVGPDVTNVKPGHYLSIRVYYYIYIYIYIYIHFMTWGVAQWL